MTNEWSFEANVARGCLPTGESLEALYGVGEWSRAPDWAECPPVVQCHRCGGRAYDLGEEIDCENCGVISYADEEETDGEANRTEGLQS